MKLYFIRHGKTNWNEEGKIQGSCDIELNYEGIMQAEKTSKKILNKDYKINKIYSSKQKRALKTAEIISEINNINYEEVDGLEEINLGKWQGLSWKEVEERYPKEYDKWLKNRRYTKTPEGESYEQLLRRTLRALHKIINENNNDVAIVTHNAVIMTLQCYITNTPFEQMTKFKCENSEIVEIDSDLLFKSPKIIILRGNSGSGKTTIAKSIQKKLGHRTMLISQDAIRREMLYVNDGPETEAIEAINLLIEYAHKNCEVVILEGILNSNWYNKVFENIRELYGDNIYAYYFDLPFEETIKRHSTRSCCNEFGEKEMKSWWKEKDYLKVIKENLINKDSSAEETIDRILKDIN